MPVLSAAILATLGERLKALSLPGVDKVELDGDRLTIAYGDVETGVEIDLPPATAADEDALCGLLYRALVHAGMAPTLAGKTTSPTVIVGEDRRRYEEGPTWHRLALAVAALPAKAAGKPSRAGGGDV